MFSAVVIAACPLVALKITNAQGHWERIDTLGDAIYEVAFVYALLGGTVPKMRCRWRWYEQ